jgi:putative Mg2+ transporter-C (MgtC) family protein
VGFGAGLFMLVSKYGFFDVLQRGVTLDPSRVAAQIVSGIGFLGAGIIFVRRDNVQGLTTAASVWVTAAVGTACGAGLTMLAAAATVGYFFIALCLRQVTHHLNGSSLTTSVVTVRYFDGRGTLREVLARTCDVGYVIGEVLTRAVGPVGDGADGNGSHAQPLATATSQVVEVSLQLRGKGSITDLATLLSGVDGVVSINAGTADETAGDT